MNCLRLDFLEAVGECQVESKGICHKCVDNYYLEPATNSCLPCPSGCEECRDDGLHWLLHCPTTLYLGPKP